MKKIICLIIAVVLMFSVNIMTFADETIRVTLDGSYIEFDVMPQIINGRTMVPIRAIFEKMGAVVEWDANTSSAICTKDGTVVKMTVDSMDMYVNNQLVKMDIAPVVIDGRTLAPARYVAEAFGADVQWKQETNTVVITSKTETQVENEVIVDSAPADEQVSVVNYYRTPTGKKYHMDPECGGKNSYETTDISGLTPCAKCAK